MYVHASVRPLGAPHQQDSIAYMPPVHRAKMLQQTMLMHYISHIDLHVVQECQVIPDRVL
jgi:hypothetical protein